jgi:hypothetical protein
MTRTMPSRATQRSTPRRVRSLRSYSRTGRRQPPWLQPPVPVGFWDSISNRRWYVRWLGRQLGYRNRTDWYYVKTDDFKRNGGGSPLTSQWKDSAIVAVMEAFPDYEWKEWLFEIAPRSFWRERVNRHRYLQWLGERLGYRTPSDWYQVTNQDFEDHKGRGCLVYYNSTVSAAVMDFLPHYDWKEWLFSRTPKDFWRVRKNRVRYIVWLAARLEYKRPRDWYQVTADAFIENCGRELLRLFGQSPMAVVMDAYPRTRWHEWMFARVPAGFWEDPKNRLRYVEWLGTKLRIRRREDWARVGRIDICENYGGALLLRYHSYTELLDECVPQLNGLR